MNNFKNHNHTVFSFIKYFIHKIGLEYIKMKAELQPRPQSKQIRTELRPITRYVNTQQATQTFAKAKVQQQNKNYEKAVDLYLRAIMYDPNLFQAFCNMGSCYRALGHYSQAKNQYRRAIQIKNDDAISHYNLANIERIIGNYEQSIYHYEYVINLKQVKGIDIGNLYLDSLVNIGICYKNIQLLQKAIQYYERAHKVDAHDQVALYNHAMCLISMIDNIRSDIFQEVVKEKGSKALALFKQLLLVNPDNQMVRLQVLKLSRIMDSSTQNVTQTVQKLKSLLKAKNCTITVEINHEIDFCLLLLQKYQVSATREFKSINKTTESRNNQNISVNVYDSVSGSDGVVSKQIITEQQGFKLIKQGQLQLLQKKIQFIENSQLYKHVLQMAVNLELANESDANLQNAIQIYNKYFIQNNNEIAFDRISVDAHRTIGKLLQIQKKYKQSIKHFEYISTYLKSTDEKAKVCLSLGNEYQALGNSDKALQQYKLALQSQPNSYEILYNIGCILHEDGKAEQSMEYFQKFIDLIQKQPQVDLKTKNLYLADSLITIASSSQQSTQYQMHQKAANAIKQLQAETLQNQFDSTKLLAFQLSWIDLLQQKMNSLNKKSEQYRLVKQQLLQAYVLTVDIEHCPDRNAILNNCATIYYQEKLYINALACYNQVEPQSLSYNNLALTYLHLLEHYMALQNIYTALKQEPEDPIVQFNFQVITWIYGIQQPSRLSDKFASTDEERLMYRLQYGMTLIDKITSKLYESTEIMHYSQIDQTINWILLQDNLLSICQQSQKIRLRYILSKLRETKFMTTNFVNSQILTKCLSKSECIQVDLQDLIENLKQMSLTSIEAASSLFYLFMLTNKQKGSKILQLIKSSYSIKKHILNLDLDRRITVAPQDIQREFIISSTNNLIADLCSWQCELESKLVAIISIIFKNYYHSNFTKPLQMQYHFPRHNQLLNCNNTVSKLAFIIFKVLQITPNITPQGPNLSQMKQSVVSAITHCFNPNTVSSTTIKFNSEFLPLTIYTYFQTKQQCLVFLKQLQKQSSSKKSIQVSQHCEQIIVIVSGIIRLRCEWNQNNLFQNNLKQLLESPLSPEIQALMYLQSGLQVLRKSSEIAKQVIQANPLFKQ